MKYDQYGFLHFLHFPDEWEPLYTYELFQTQLKYMIEDLGNAEIVRCYTSGKYGAGSEHYRYGAFRWVMDNVDVSNHEQLRKAVEKDMDDLMKRQMINEILKSTEEI